MKSPTQLEIRRDDLSGPEIAEFLEAHVAEMRAVTPPESKHALDIEQLRRPDISFWTAWNGPTLVGCGALKALDVDHAEIKSMRTSTDARGQGIASRLLRHLLEQARQRGFRRISLETGSFPFFEPARRLYEKFGFRPCAPFADYTADPNSVFMTLTL